VKIEPVALSGRHVRLVPLAEEHVGPLARAGRHDSLWRYMPFRIDSEEDAARWVGYADTMLAGQEGLVFATLDAETDELVGSTGFLAAAPTHRRVEIGATWVVPGRQRSAVNTEAKYLMLGHAFETWGCRRVEFKTDALNHRSRRALGRLGAREEGTLRAHMSMPSGRIRDTVYFSILEDEWAGVKVRLESMLNR
jgi:RimJ/RimL family protein N-acetyltransferase